MTKLYSTGRNIVGITLLVLGLLGFFLIDILSFIYPVRDNSRIELPLSDPKGILVDKDQRVYVGIPDYSRIQIYSNGGRFLGSICFDSGDGGDFRLGLDKNGNILVATLRNNMVYVFEEDGNLVSQKKSADGYEKIGNQNETQFIEPNGIRFEIQNSIFLYPKIVKITPEGKHINIIPFKFIHWLFMEPIPSWLFASVGLFITAGSRIFERKLS